MTAPTPPPDAVATARGLLDEVLEGARANERPDLVRRLSAARTALAGPPAPATVAEAAGAALHALESLEVDLRSRRATLADPDRAGRLWAELGRTASALEEFRGRVATWGQLLAEGFASLSSDVDFRLLTGLRAVAAESDQVVAGSGRRVDDGQLDAWLAERVAAEAAGVRALLDTGAARVATRVAGHLQLAEAPAPPPSPEPVLPDVRASTRAAVLPAPRRGAARLLTVGMPTYGGLMMGFILPRVLDLPLPQHLLLGLAVVAACAMGGSALAVERHQRRDLQRTGLRMAARSAVDDASVALGKDTRDALREIQRQVREALAAAATTRARDLEEAHRAAVAAAGAVREAPAALADVDADLRELDRLRARARAVLLPAPPAGPRLAVVGGRHAS